MSEHTPELTDEDAQVLEELAELQESDPALYAEIVREGFQEAESQEHGQAVVEIINASQEHRQAEDRKLLGHLFGDPDDAA